MPRKIHKPEEIVGKLRQVDVLVSQGQSVADAIRAIGVTEVSARRAPRRRDLLHAQGGPDRHRKLAAPLQRRATACLARIPRSPSRGLRTAVRRMAGCAIPASSAGQAPHGATTAAKLTWNPDHSAGAGQTPERPCCRSNHAL
jgi:hypothetical protein